MPKEDKRPSSTGYTASAHRPKQKVKRQCVKVERRLAEEYVIAARCSPSIRIRLFMAHWTRLFALLATCVLLSVNAASYFLSKNGEIASLTPTKWSGTSVFLFLPLPPLYTYTPYTTPITLGFKCPNADDLECGDRVCRMFPNGRECCLCKEPRDNQALEDR